MDLFFTQEILVGNLIKLGIAVLLGGLVGFEREVRDKAAGFRTMILICTGAAIFTSLSLELGADTGEPTRIAANIVSGIGFLGAGVIIREGGQIKGLTTASTIWLVAALGMATGAGNLVLSISATGVILIVLWLFPWIEGKMELISDTVTYEVVFLVGKDKAQNVDQLWRHNHLKVRDYKVFKHGNRLTYAWTIVGRSKFQKMVVEKLIADPDIDELSY